MIGVQPIAIRPSGCKGQSVMTRTISEILTEGIVLAADCLCIAGRAPDANDRERAAVDAYNGIDVLNNDAELRKGGE